MFMSNCSSVERDLCVQPLPKIAEDDVRLIIIETPVKGGLKNIKEAC